MLRNYLDTFKLQSVAIGSLFKTKAMFRRVIVATVTMFFQQFTRVNAVLYYAPSILAALGTSSNTTSLLATGVVGIAIFLASIPAVLSIGKLGRKPVLLTVSLLVRSRTGCQTSSLARLRPLCRRRLLVGLLPSLNF